MIQKNVSTIVIKYRGIHKFLTQLLFIIEEDSAD